MRRLYWSVACLKPRVQVLDVTGSTRSVGSSSRGCHAELDCLKANLQHQVSQNDPLAVVVR